MNHHPTPPPERDTPSPLTDAHFALLVLAVTAFTLIIFVLLIIVWLA